MVVTKQTVIGEILDAAPSAAPFFTRIGMHCLGCALSRGETLGQAAMAHGVDVDEIIARIEEVCKQ